MDILSLKYWIFDLDGTLTHAIHDFESIRAELDIPSGAPILETLAAMPASESETLYEQLHQIEIEHAHRAVAQPGVEELLGMLQIAGKQMGIVTRNTMHCANKALSRCGLAEYFSPECIVAREASQPKPSPDGINQLLSLWGGQARQGVMVGDYLYDLQAGRAAGTWTLYVDPDGVFPFQEHADQCIPSLGALLDATRKFE